MKEDKKNELALILAWYRFAMIKNKEQEKDIEEGVIKDIEKLYIK